ncbi:ATP-binding protein [Pedobacter miscanthi]|uniref:histidine kinase n=1 Tax=Pedobacter miscanthi TaxID=2259170 RepID=A0A366LCU5_9SPHI|nr:ATP-binding protein [Pedobacter miscanthi]RBQ11727.1 PAS domain-containing sensor histidine kinase [Pedobacter miscanthi]
MTDPRSYSNKKSNLVQAMEQRFLALAHATSDVVYSLSPDWEIMYELDGRGFLKNSDRPITGWKAINVFAGDLEIVNEAIAASIRNKKTFALEHRVNRADGTTGWTFSRAIPLIDANGEITEWIGTASDITSRKEAEIALQESKAKALEQKRIYETITSGTPDLMYVFDLNYNFIYANEALLRMWGKTAQDAIGKGLLENGYEQWHAEMHWGEIDTVVASAQPIRGEVTFPHATLGKRYYDYIFTPVFSPDGRVEAVAGTTRDVTEIRQTVTLLQQTSEKLKATNEKLAAANERLQAANEKLLAVNEELSTARNRIVDTEKAMRHAIEAAHLGTWSVEIGATDITADSRAKALFGFLPDEPLTLPQLLACVLEDYRSNVSDQIRLAIHDGKTLDVTYPASGFRDNTLRWLRAIGDFDRKREPGAKQFMTGILMDVTEQKNDELRKNDFIAMVSHELKTPLTSMKAFVQLAQRRLTGGGDQTAALAMDKAEHQVSKMSSMINGFLNLSILESGKIQLNLELFNLEKLIENIEKDTQATVFSHTILFAPVEQTIVHADEEKISHVIQNFISNAVKYSPRGSTIKVACINDETEARVSVSDSGIGIDSYDLPKVFDRYYRVEGSKLATVSGFGIGLYICKEIIIRHGGRIWAESDPGKGSKFSFTIPMPTT